MTREQQPHLAPFTHRASIFVEIVQDMVPDMLLDYSAESIAILEAFIAQQFDPPGSKYVGENLPVDVGCYVGEVIIRTLGGHWNKEGRPEINDIGPITAVFPLRKASKRFQNGSEDSLLHYYKTIKEITRR